MGKGSKYKALSSYLLSKEEDEILLSFQEIEEIIDNTLPNSSEKHNEWWANDKTHTQAVAWLEAGFKTIEVSDTKKIKKIKFKRI